MNQNPLRYRIILIVSVAGRLLLFRVVYPYAESSERTAGGVWEVKCMTTCPYRKLAFYVSLFDDYDEEIGTKMLLMVLRKYMAIGSAPVTDWKAEFNRKLVTLG